MFRKKELLNSKNTVLPKISIVVPAYNEESCIEEKIINVCNQKYPQSLIELTIASDGSSDKTVQIAKKLVSNSSCKLVVVDNKTRAGKVNVLNRTVPECTGDIVVFTDANAMFNEECLSVIAARFVDAEVGCVTGRKGVKSRKGSNEGLYWKFESWLKHAEGEIGIIPGAEGAIYAMRKELFLPVPERTAVDDFLISVNVFKAGKLIVFENNSISIEEDVDTIGKEWIRKKRIAAGSFFNLTKTIFLWNFIKRPLVFYSFFSHKVLRWFSPFLAIGILVLSISTSRFHVAFLLPGTSLFISTLIMFYGLSKLKANRDVNKIISIVTYFFFTVWAQLFGFIDFFLKKQNAIWKKTR
jgi:cellulose synthase/poly-beta-1,6-N-acetylglucosamine synthase-like glycosyltransferase